MTTTEPFVISGTVQKQAWEDGIMPPVENLGGGLWSIPVPMPQSSLRYVIVYALELTDGVAIIDAGWDTDAAWSALNDGLGAAGYAMTDVKAALITHIHPDHYGLAGRVREASGAWIALHPADAAALSQRYVDMDDLFAKMRAHLADCGVPPQTTDDMRGASMGVRPFVSFAEPDVLLEDGDKPDTPGWDLRAVWTPGHSPGHLCFYAPERKLLMSGDHVLPRITPNISFHPQQSASPLADFIESLAKVALLETEEVLPAHEYRFRGLAARVTQLTEHHEERFREILATVSANPGCTAWEVAPTLTWSRPWDQIESWMRRAALGEALAHMMVLESRGRLRREGRSPERWETTGR
ncbi:MAG TPA: MBL fold metallo-hydrolase [Acidimicrobiales bacterium]|nr:MBL fold metallo-hydrolase [Acidimicrobiales bacterium]